MWISRVVEVKHKKHSTWNIFSFINFNKIITTSRSKPLLSCHDNFGGHPGTPSFESSWADCGTSDKLGQARLQRYLCCLTFSIHAIFIADAIWGKRKKLEFRWVLGGLSSFMERQKTMSKDKRRGWRREGLLTSSKTNSSISRDYIVRSAPDVLLLFMVSEK